MKAVVLKRFRDKETGEMREAGDEFTCTKKRFAEIKSVDPGLVEEKAEAKPDASEQ